MRTCAEDGTVARLSSVSKYIRNQSFASNLELLFKINTSVEVGENFHQRPLQGVQDAFATDRDSLKDRLTAELTNVGHLFGGAGAGQVAFEFLRISKIAGLATYLAQPGGSPPVAFTRTDGGEDWVRFENPQHDFPQRVEYRRSGQALQATITGPGENGTEMSIPFIYQPCD